MSPRRTHENDFGRGPLMGARGRVLAQNRRGKGQNPETAGWVFLGKKIQKPAGNGTENCGGHVAVC